MFSTTKVKIINICPLELRKFDTPTFPTDLSQPLCACLSWKGLETARWVPFSDHQVAVTVQRHRGKQQLYKDQEDAQVSEMNAEEA